MTLAPRFLVNFWAGVLAARHNRRQKSLGRGVAAQERTFGHLTAQLAGTEYGRGVGLAAGIGYDRFRESVPPVTAAQLRPFVDRMTAGEADVLWPGVCRFFAETAGTTADPQRLPVTGEMLRHFRTGLRDAVLAYAVRAGHAGVFLGRHLHVGASTTLVEAGHGYIAALDGILALSLSPWVEANLYAPPPALAHLPESTEKYRRIAQAMIGRDVTLIAGTPAAVLSTVDSIRLAASRDAARVPALQSIWPNLECYLHTGAPLGLFGEELRRSLAPEVRMHDTYAAAEGFIAAQDGEEAGTLRLHADSGLFFEFLPATLWQPDNLARLGPKLVPLAQVEAGVDYVIFVTTPSGLCRCSLGDIVHFESVDPPRLHVVGRTALQLNDSGERVGARELSRTLLAVCAAHGWQAVNFHVAPYYTRSDSGVSRSCHEWWVELRPLSVKTPTGPVLAPLLDEELARRSPTYAARRQARGLEAPVVRLVIPGVFDEWARSHRFGASPSKMPRCRPDRSIADQLVALTRFYTSTQAPFVAGPSRSEPSGASVIREQAGNTTNPLGISREQFR